MGILKPRASPLAYDVEYRLPWRGREPDLIVRDDVHRAADIVGPQPRQVQRFRDDALAREGRVAVNQDRKRGGFVDDRGAGRRRVGAGSACHAHDDRVHELEVARVRRHRDRDLGRRFLAYARAGASVVLHVAGPAEILAEGLFTEGFLELGEHLRVALVHDVRQHVEAAAVGHPDQHVTHAGHRRVRNQLIDDRDHHVETFNREARLADERPLQESLEGLDFGDAVEEFDRLEGLMRGAEGPGLDGVAEPLALLGHEDVRDVVSDAGAVDLAEPVDGLAGVRCAFRQRPAGQARGQQAQIGLRQPVRFGMKRGVANRVRPQGVDPRGEMAITSNRFGEVDGADDGAEIGGIGWGLSPCRSAGDRPQHRGPRSCEGFPSGGVYRGGIGEVALVELECIRFVDPSQPQPLGHNLPILAAFKISSVRGGKFSEGSALHLILRLRSLRRNRLQILEDLPQVIV